MDIWTSVILGIVEGFSEFLPISSTGHLILAGKLLGLEETDFIKSFDIAIQLGAILSVVVLYWRTFLVDSEVVKKVAVAFLPTGIIGFVLYKLIKTFLLGSSQVVLWSLLIGGIFIVIFEMLHREKEDATGELVGNDVSTSIPDRCFSIPFCYPRGTPVRPQRSSEVCFSI